MKLTGCFIYLTQPLGSMLSGFLTDPIGRKYGMMAVNIPHIIGWLLLAFASSIEQLFIGSAVLGFGVGCLEAPTISFIGEIRFVSKNKNSKYCTVFFIANHRCEDD